jgi:hypothetical protein
MLKETIILVTLSVAKKRMEHGSNLQKTKYMEVIKQSPNSRMLKEDN